MRLRERVQDLWDGDKGYIRSEGYVLFIDFKAAYDSVNHNILFSKLEKKVYTLN